MLCPFRRNVTLMACETDTRIDGRLLHLSPGLAKPDFRHDQSFAPPVPVEIDSLTSGRPSLDAKAAQAAQR